MEALRRLREARGQLERGWGRLGKSWGRLGKVWGRLKEAEGRLGDPLSLKRNCTSWGGLWLGSWCWRAGSVHPIPRVTAQHRPRMPTLCSAARRAGLAPPGPEPESTVVLASSLRSRRWLCGHRTEGSKDAEPRTPGSTAHAGKAECRPSGKGAAHCPSIWSMLLSLEKQGT